MFRSIIAIILIITWPSSSWSQEIDPGQAAIKTPRYNPDSASLAEGTYYYNISWQGITVADAKIEVQEQLIKDSALVQVHAHAWTGGIIAALYKLNHHSASVFNGMTFAPVAFHSVQKENKKTQYRQIYFYDDGRIESDKWREGRERDPRISFVSDNMTLDPISAIFYARSLPMDVGVERSFDVYTGKHRFLISLKVEGVHEIEVGTKKELAYKVVPKVQKLTDSKDDKKFRSAVIWVSADDQRNILKIESEVWVGSVVAEIQRFEPRFPVAKTPEPSANRGQFGGNQTLSEMILGNSDLSSIK